MPPATAAAKRFPQPVLVGTLIGRRVLKPVESQPTVGVVDAVVQKADGQVAIVVDYGGWWGIGSRRIAVPVEAMVLLGPYMEIVDFTDLQLAQFPSFTGGDPPLPAAATIKVGLARPSH